MGMPMAIEKIMDMALGYRETARTLPYRDSQLEKKYVTLEEIGGGTRVALETNGNYAVLADDGTVERIEKGPEAWKALSGKEYARWSPVRVLRVEKIETSGGKDAAERAAWTFEAVAKDLEAKAREEAARLGRENEPTRPAWTGDGRTARAFVRNGLEATLMTPRRYSAELASRRRFGKDPLPSDPSFREGKGFYLILTADEKTKRKMGRNLGAAIRAAESDVLSWLGDADAKLSRLPLDADASA